MKGDRFGIRMSGIAADLVLKTGGEMSRMRIGVDKIGKPETKNIAGKVRSVAVPGIGPDFGDSSTARFVY